MQKHAWLHTDVNGYFDSNLQLLSNVTNWFLRGTTRRLTGFSKEFCMKADSVNQLSAVKVSTQVQHDTAQAHYWQLVFIPRRYRNLISETKNQDNAHRWCASQTSTLLDQLHGGSMNCPGGLVYFLIALYKVKVTSNWLGYNFDRLTTVLKSSGTLLSWQCRVHLKKCVCIYDAV